MKATVDARAFSEALDKASTVLKRSRIPELESVCLRFGDGKCVLTATDLETWLVADIPAQGEPFVCGFRRNKEAAKTCHYFDGLLAIEMVESESNGRRQYQIHLSCGSRKAEFDGFDPEDLPQRNAKMDIKASFLANPADLLTRINRVKYAVLKPFPGNRPTQTCVQFKENSIFCLDGSRAACDRDPNFSVPMEMLMSGDSLAYLKLFGPGEVTVNVGVSHIQFAGDGLTLYCPRKGPETFNLEQALPKDYIGGFTVAPKEFLQELDYLKDQLLPKERPFVRFEDGELSLDAVPRQVSTAVQIEGTVNMAIGFDLRFMSDALKQFSGEKRVKVRISGSCSPILVEAEGRNDFALVLPVRLRQDRAAA